MTEFEIKALEKMDKTNKLLSELVLTQNNLLKLMGKYDSEYINEVEKSEGYIAEG